MNKNVEQVAEAGLCTGCGACVAVCPHAAVSMQETVDGCLLPEVRSVCTDCGKCLKVCPGIITSESGRLPKGVDPFYGIVMQTWLGTATEEKIAAAGQSGGVVSAILCHLFKTGQISAAIIAEGVCNKEGCHTVPFVAKSPEDVLRHQGSQYVLNPQMSCLRELEAIDGGVALVGLSCHMHALENIISEERSIAEKIRFRLGLICDRSLNAAVSNYLCLKAGVSPEGVKQIIFRDKRNGGYPGNVSIIMRDGTRKSLASGERVAVKDYFTPLRCRLCFDKLNVYSDITCGDPWGMAEADRKGATVCIVRSTTGLRIIRQCTHAGRLQLKECRKEDVFPGHCIDERKRNWLAAMHLWVQNNGQMPYLPSALKRIIEQTSVCDEDIIRMSKLLQYAVKARTFSQRKEYIYDVLSRMGALRDDPSYSSTKPLVIQVFGAGFVNKGALLMLQACIQRIKEKYPDAIITVPVQSYLKNFLLRGVVPAVKGLIDTHDIDVVLDASGFALSDQIGINSITYRKEYYRRIKAGRGIVILMPQAMGPFIREETRSEISALFRHVDLAFVRDQDSLKHLSLALADSGQVECSADFTIDLHGKEPDNCDDYKDAVCIVPNMRMIDRCGTEAAPFSADDYYEFVYAAISSVAEKGLRPFFLIHEGNNDLILADKLNSLVGGGYEMFVSNDPLVMKGVLGACRAVISSRFHALVSALSQGVPVVAAGWSHKYKELLADYDFAEGYLPLGQYNKEELGGLIELITSSGRRKKIEERLKAATVRQKKAVDQMWHEVFSLISSVRDAGSYCE